MRFTHQSSSWLTIVALFVASIATLPDVNAQPRPRDRMAQRRVEEGREERTRREERTLRERDTPSWLAREVRPGVRETSAAREFLERRGLDSARQGNVIEAFSELRVVRLEKDLAVSRYSNRGEERGRWWAGGLEFQSPKNKMALPDSNRMEVVSRGIIPAGTEVLIGKAAERFNKPGGAYQVYVPSPGEITIIKKTPVISRTH